MFGETLLRLARKGSFGWTPLTYVAEVGRRSAPACLSDLRREDFCGSTMFPWSAWAAMSR